MEEHRNTVRKRRFKLVGIALLILLPTILGIVTFKLVSDNYSVFSDDTYNIRLYDSVGTLIAEDSASVKNAKEGSTVALFAPITTGFFETSNIPQSVNKSRYLRAVVEYMNELNEYIFYFSTIDDSIYCSENRKKTYQLSDDEATSILSSKYAEQFYAAAVPPSLTTISGDIIIPYSVNWRYKSVSGEYFKSKSYETSNETKSYTFSGALAVNFSIPPDTASIVILQDGIQIFAGKYDEMANAEIDKSMPVDVEIVAEWEEKSGSDFCGKLSYSFNARVTEKADFEISGESFDIGSVCVISANKVEDVSKIRFNSSPNLPYSVEFAKNGNGAIAVIPITKEMSNEVYDFMLSYGSSFETFSLTVNEYINNGILISCSVNDKRTEGYYREEYLLDLETLKKFSYDNSKSDKLYTGEFLKYGDNGASVRAKFGDYYEALNIRYESVGTEYCFDSAYGVGAKVMNNGQVIKTGYNEFLGNYVIVSHGCGISTWYAHLSVIDVREGQYVIRGETLGKAGDTGLSDRENIFVITAIRGEFVDTESLSGKVFE